VLVAGVEGGGRVVLIARRHGLSEGLLYNWRLVAKEATPTAACEYTACQADSTPCHASTGTW
jgi:transposase-like protein